LEQPERSSKDEKVWLTIKVADSGIGIPPETKDKIFETFYQNESGPKILNQGTGIGLSIAKEFVKMHNGTITVESEPGEGSCFIVTIPFTTAGDEPVEVNLLQDYDQEDEAVSSTENETLSIPADLTEDIPLLLIVEDDEDFRFYLKDNLKSTYRVLEASNGKEGWQKALAGHPDIIVSDVNMPELDGIALGKKIRSDKRTKHIPLILLTASTKEDQQIRGLESGASDYMTKPFNFAVLNAKINNLLRLNQTFKETYTRQVKVVHDDIEVESE